MKKNSALRKSYIVVITIVILIGLLALIFRTAVGVKLDVPAPVLSEGWFYEGVELIEYPAKVSIDTDDSFTIYKTIEATDKRFDLLLYTDHQDVIVRLDDTVVYMSTQAASSASFYANLHHMVTIENNTNLSRVLSITYHSPYQRTSGLIAPIYETDESTGVLYTYIISQHIWYVVFGMLFILIGIVTLAISHVVDQATSRGRFYLGLFAITFGLWVIARSTLLQFVTNNVYILGGLSLTLFMILPIPILMYYKSHITKRFEQETLGLIAYFGLQAIVITMLQIAGVLDFVKPVLFVSIMTLIIMSFLLAFIVQDVLNHNEIAKKFSRYYGILFLYAFITFIDDQTFNHDNLSIYSLAVLVLLSLVVLLDYIFFIEKRLKLSYLSEDYARLAYMDRLTGSKNRHAYEEDFERYFSDNRLKNNMRLVFFDFDGLKQINDQYGHVEGDFVLKEGFTSILNAFGRYGECYRIGGDEFSCIIQSLDDDLYQNCKKQLINDIKTFSTYHKFDLHISVGTATYQEGIDEKPNDMIIRADKNMYENKNGHKNV